MAATPSWADRLRIERAVWTVDFLISSLPARRQRTILRELRGNLEAAAAEVGTAEAVRRLGSLRRLARDYLDAEYGEGGPRPEWLKGLFWAIFAESIILVLALGGNQGFMDGVLAANAHASGTYTWHALAPLIPSEDVTFDDGRLRALSLTFSMTLPIVPAAAFAIGARLWRLLTARLRARTPVQ